jgi:hypothetical protein
MLILLLILSRLTNLNEPREINSMRRCYFLFYKKLEIQIDFYGNFV